MKLLSCISIENAGIKDTGGVSMMVAVRSKRGFTLIELLVMISIIVILIAIMFPALTGVRSQARSVVCKTHQRSWNSVASLIASENNGRFKLSYSDSSSWVEPLADYADLSSDLIFCPEATRVTASASGLGSADEAWRYSYTDKDSNYHTVTGSYGLNYWLTDVPTRRLANPNDRRKFWRRSSSLRSDTPILADCAWLASMPDSNRMLPSGQVPTTKDWIKTFGRTVGTGRMSYAYDMSNYCIPRHANGTSINIAFADGAVATVKLQDLWNIKWHREFNLSSDVRIPWLDGESTPRLR